MSTNSKMLISRSFVKYMLNRNCIDKLLSCVWWGGGGELGYLFEQKILGMSSAFL
ncbi:hypothetical protein TPHV1_130032 [Treponema phagedenis]|uniref:Uncharacterized protein n=1 Tax=Treponema phagedenis TaxID=162 RepID=A0A0B7GQZ9_TREPH|nr:hypothetical protein TPHV1_130032 [Treponema phagedenis]